MSKDRPLSPGPSLAIRAEIACDAASDLERILARLAGKAATDPTISQEAASLINAANRTYRLLKANAVLTKGDAPCRTETQPPW